MLYTKKNDPALLNEVILSYRHDIGLLEKSAVDTLKHQASMWLEAWERYLPKIAIDEADQAFCVDILLKMKAEHEKRCKVYDLYGVNMSNYENIMTECLMACLLKILKMDVQEEIEWWLYESSEKIYYIGEDSYLVEQPSDFIKFLIFIKSKE